MAGTETLPWHEEGGKLLLAESLFANFSHHLSCPKCGLMKSSKVLPSGSVFSRDQGGNSPEGTKRRVWRCRECRKVVLTTAFLEICFSKLEPHQLEHCQEDVLSDLDITQPQYRDLHDFLLQHPVDKTTVATVDLLSEHTSSFEEITTTSTSTPFSTRHLSRPSRKCDQKLKLSNLPTGPALSSLSKRKCNRPQEALGSHGQGAKYTHLTPRPLLLRNLEGNYHGHKDQHTTPNLESRPAQSAVSGALPSAATTSSLLSFGLRADQYAAPVSNPRGLGTKREGIHIGSGDIFHLSDTTTVPGTSSESDRCSPCLLSIGYINVQGLSSDKWEACCRLTNKSYDLLFIAETWFVDHNSRVRDARFIASTTTAHRGNKATRDRGGIYLVGKPSAKEQVLASWSLETTPFSISFNMGTIQLSGVYFPPYSISKSKIEYCLTDRLRHSNIVLGDFNVRASAFVDRKGGAGLLGRAETMSRWLKGNGNISHVQPHHTHGRPPSGEHQPDLCFATGDILPRIQLALLIPQSLGIRTDHRYALQLHILPSPAGDHVDGGRERKRLCTRNGEAVDS